MGGRRRRGRPRGRRSPPRCRRTAHSPSRSVLESKESEAGRSGQIQPCSARGGGGGLWKSLALTLSSLYYDPVALEDHLFPLYETTDANRTMWPAGCRFCHFDDDELEKYAVPAYGIYAKIAALPYQTIFARHTCQR